MTTALEPNEGFGAGTVSRIHCHWHFVARVGLMEQLSSASEVVVSRKE